MDLIENYKKVWDNQSEDSNKASSIEIYKIAQLRSTSIVKWIFIIGILEFVILNSLPFFFDMKEAYNEYRRLGLESFDFYYQIIYYFISFYFLLQFYLNYKRISTTDSTKVLLKKIIKTRKTVKNYVLFNLSYFAFIMIIVIIATIQINPDDLTNKKILLIIVNIVIITLLFLGFLWLFYQLLYGILLKKLNRNYKELKSLETL